MIVFDKPKALTDAPLHYCPGCTHGIVHRLVAEVIDGADIPAKLFGILWRWISAVGEIGSRLL